MGQPVDREFGRRLRLLRRSRGLTQRDLAGTALSVSYVSLLEAGRRTPTEETVRILADALGCRPAELTGTEISPSTRPVVLTIRFGHLALASGDAAAAQQHFESVLGTPELEPLLDTEARLGLAGALAAQGRLDLAAREYERLVRDATVTPHHVASTRVVAAWCRCLYELGELVRVTEVGGGALERLDQLQARHSAAAVELLATVAAAFFELGEVQQAHRLLQSGGERVDRLGPPRTRAAALWDASRSADASGRHREALELAEEALAHHQQGSDRWARARLLSVYGFLLLRQDPPRADEACRVLEDALRDLAETGRDADRATVCTELSRAHHLLGNQQRALELARQSLAHLGPEATLERGRAHTALATVLAATGEREAARETFAQAAASLAAVTTTRQAARAWVELGNALAEAGDPVAAVEAFRNATASMHLHQGLQPPARPGDTDPADQSGRHNRADQSDPADRDNPSDRNSLS